MFNLIGSLFNFGGRTEEQQEQSSQTNTSVSNSGEECKRTLVENSTQTSNTNATRKDKTLNNEPSTNDQQMNVDMTNEQQDDANSVINKSMSGEDWVIVDKMDDCEPMTTPSNLNRPLINHIGINTSMHRSVVHQTESNDSVDTQNTGHTDQPSVSSHPQRVDEEPESDDVLLGSFFERNEREEMNTEEQMVVEQQQQQVEEQQPSKRSREDWLITPLPCLTSMTPSKQRSIIESDPLENLLIEHPSMSVFVAATSSASCSDNSSNDLEESSQISQSNWQKVESKKRKKKNKKQAIESSSSSNVVIATAAAVAVESTVTEMVQQEQEQQQTVLVEKITPVVAEKRKESEKSVETPVTQSPTLSPLALIRKRGKKSKKASSPSISSSASVNSLTSASNKENLQVLLFTPYKKGVSNKNSKETANLNKKQMKRNNKLATTRQANSKQRKYHNLQQPAAFYSSAQKVF